ncbi:hypothetical protein AB205_0119750 [Aquarana catesbeiana]|uniref:Oligoribonuclease, mitochondrial n=1 Tax=Aquarana catesbeiana TaxID=8400 RepID=A0A2G9RD33_AQUCT|nr:hypothetical protein AB205_0119750 [Aquarana catesbeiana]
MTGLDITKDQIIEMACIITDSELNILAEGPNLIIKQPDEMLDGMSEWCKEHHGKSGLTQAVRDSKISLPQAEYEFLSFIRQHTPPGVCPLAGNSVHVDKVFLNKYMPQFMRHLHYRIVDVSTVKELCRRWYPVEYEHAFKKASSHRKTGEKGPQMIPCFRHYWHDGPVESIKILSTASLLRSVGHRLNGFSGQLWNFPLYAHLPSGPTGL